MPVLKALTFARADASIPPLFSTTAVRHIGAGLQRGTIVIARNASAPWEPEVGRASDLALPPSVSGHARPTRRRDRLKTSSLDSAVT